LALPSGIFHSGWSVLHHPCFFPSISPIQADADTARLLNSAVGRGSFVVILQAITLAVRAANISKPIPMAIKARVSQL
jgi:hypothetical protein